MNQEDREFIHIVFNQEMNLHDELLNEFLGLKGSIEYISTWIEDFHNEEVYDNDEEKVALLATIRKIRHIMEDEIQ